MWVINLMLLLTAIFSTIAFVMGLIAALTMDPKNLEISTKQVLDSNIKDIFWKNNEDFQNWLNTFFSIIYPIGIVLFWYPILLPLKIRMWIYENLEIEGFIHGLIFKKTTNVNLDIENIRLVLQEKYTNKTDNLENIFNNLKKDYGDITFKKNKPKEGDDFYCHTLTLQDNKQFIFEYLKLRSSKDLVYVSSVLIVATATAS